MSSMAIYRWLAQQVTFHWVDCFDSEVNLNSNHSASSSSKNFGVLRNLVRVEVWPVVSKIQQTSFLYVSGTRVYMR